MFSLLKGAIVETRDFTRACAQIVNSGEMEKVHTRLGGDREFRCSTSGSRTTNQNNLFNSKVLVT